MFGFFTQYFCCLFCYCYTNCYYILSILSYYAPIIQYIVYIDSILHVIYRPVSRTAVLLVLPLIKKQKQHLATVSDTLWLLCIVLHKIKIHKYCIAKITIGAEINLLQWHTSVFSCLFVLYVFLFSSLSKQFVLYFPMGLLIEENHRASYSSCHFLAWVV